MKYRKKPVVIEAVQFDGTIQSIESLQIPECSQQLGSRALQIQTLEGEMTAQPGDWIIRGVKGEFYPCKPDIFAATYDEVMTPHPAPAPGEMPTPRTSAKVEELSVMVCNCGSPLNGSHDHDTCGEPQRQWMAGAEEELEAHARTLERENQRLRKALRRIRVFTADYGPPDVAQFEMWRIADAALATGGTADAVKEG